MNQAIFEDFLGFLLNKHIEMGGVLENLGQLLPPMGSMEKPLEAVKKICQ